MRELHVAGYNADENSIILSSCVLPHEVTYQGCGKFG